MRIEASGGSGMVAVRVRRAGGLLLAIVAAGGLAAMAAGCRNRDKAPPALDDLGPSVRGAEPAQRFDVENAVASGPDGLALSITAYQTVAGIGAGQGIFTREGRIYLLGDLGPSDPDAGAPVVARRGVIREYTLEARPDAGAAIPELSWTAREIRLTVGGQEVCPHPTGLTHHPIYGTFLSDTVDGVGRILHIDWHRALETGTLDGAVLNTTLDDAAANGSRAEFVVIDGRVLLATADYGATDNRVRLMDPLRLATAATTSEPGVVVASAPAGPYVQSVRWMPERGELWLVQNITAGLGYRLTMLPLGAILAGDDLSAVPTVDLSYPETEFEGFLPLDPWLGAGHVMMLDAYPSANIHFGVINFDAPPPATDDAGDDAAMEDGAMPEASGMGSGR